MSFFANLFRSKEPETEVRQESPSEEPPTCPHTVLVPQWDSVADIGNDDKATGYRCDACSLTFTPAEARALRASEAERVRDVTESGPE
jgi:hypothetical protein